MNLANVTDIATLLGVSKQRASQIAASKGFPKPLDTVGKRKDGIWRVSDVERWATKNRRTK